MFLQICTLNVLLFLFKVSNVCSSPVKDLNELGSVIFVSVLYRHGDRTPIDPYPTDPYKNRSYWPVDFGQLTNAGKMQHLQRGKWLKARYSTLLSEDYLREEILVQSTDVDRTLMSAESNLAGMYPPKGDQIWGAIPWQPVPVHTIPERLDKLLAMKPACKKYDEEMKLAKKSPEMVALDKKYKDLYAYLTAHTGTKVNDLQSVEYVQNTLFIESLYNLTLPEWTKKVYPQPMLEASEYSFMVPTFNKPLKRLKAGPLLEDIVTHMKQKVAGQLNPDRRMWVYSAHDTTVANLLNTLGVFKPHCPPYAATVMVELRRDSANKHYVTVVYKKAEKEEAEVMNLPGCGSKCTLEEFTSLYQDVMPQDWDTECHSHHLFDLTSDLPYNSLAIFEEFEQAPTVVRVRRDIDGRI